MGGLAAYGRKVLVTCRDEARLSVYDATTRTLNDIPGIRSAAATWTLLGDGIVYVAQGTCEPSAPICKTKLMLRDLRTGATTQIDEGYGVAVDLTLTGEGVTVWRPVSNGSFQRLDAEVGTWILRGTTLARFSKLRLVDGDKGRHLLESEETYRNPGCCTYVVLRMQQEQRLTPNAVSNERAIAMLEDGRILAFRIERGLFDGSMVVYRGAQPERVDPGRFAAFRVVRSEDWILGAELSGARSLTLHGYRISDGLFASTPGGNITALAPLGAEK